MIHKSILTTPARYPRFTLPTWILVVLGCALALAGTNLSAQSEPYQYVDQGLEESMSRPSDSTTRSTSAAGGRSLTVASPYLTAAVSERIEPSRANRWSAFAGVEGRANQIAAMRSAYGMEDAPITYRLGAGIDVDFNDNVFLSEDDVESDIVLRPQARLAAFWNLTELNMLSLEVVAGYEKYLGNSELDDFFVESSFAPASRVDLQIFVGDFVITVYDEFSYSADPFQIVGIDGKKISGEGEFGRFTNSLGADVLWDLNDLVLTLGVSQYNFWAIGSNVEQLERGTQAIAGGARITVGPSLQAGVEANASLTNYAENFQNDGDGISYGVFFEWALTDNTRLRGAFGWQNLNFATGGANGDTDDHDDYYANVSISNRLNQFISHSLQLGHEATLGLNTNFLLSDFIRYSADFDIIQNTTLSLQLGYSQNDESGGIFEDDHNLYYLSVGARYRLGERTHLAGSYTYNQRDSDREGFGYDQNIFRISLQYNY